MIMFLRLQFLMNLPKVRDVILSSQILILLGRDFVNAAWSMTHRSDPMSEP